MHNSRRLHRYRCHRVTGALGVENRAEQILRYGQLDHEFVAFGGQLDQFDLAGDHNPHIGGILSLMIEHFGSLIISQVRNSGELRLRGFIEDLEKPMLADDVDRLRKLLHLKSLIDLKLTIKESGGSELSVWRGAALALAQRTSVFFPERGRPKHGLNRRLPRT